MFYGSGLQGKRLMMFPENGNDGFLVARIGVENNHSAFWAPYSQKLYACLGNHPEKTPRNKGSQEGIEPATAPPVVSTPSQDRDAQANFVVSNIPLQLVATEICNCAFVSNFAVRTNGALDLNKTLERCTKLVNPDFSALPSIFRPKISARTVRINDSATTKSVQVVLETSPITRYSATSTLIFNSGSQQVCSFVSAKDIPKETVVKKGLLKFLAHLLTFLK
jgi:hypothetical protein